MNNYIHLTDNDVHGRVISDSCAHDMLKIASIRELSNAPDLLVYPYSFKETPDKIGDEQILYAHDAHFSSDGKCTSLRVCTGNLVGFIGLNDTCVSIHSRFASSHSTSSGTAEYSDYFLYYMLEKVLSLNVLKLEHAINSDNSILNMLFLLFPAFLKRALSQGLYKEYQTRHYDDAKLRGTIEVNRFIARDIPFRGNISYKTREYTIDNATMQLIRHTIEYIRQRCPGGNVLNMDVETTDCVSQVVQATPSYNQRERQQVIYANLRHKIHPYFVKYTELRLLCLRILRHEMMQYGKSKDKAYGILFDVAWLWEEYLNSLLSKRGFKHPQNKETTGGLPMFCTPNDKHEIFPDFYRKDFIIDAKYKHLEQSVSRDDLYQLVTYMYCRQCMNGGYMYPSTNDTRGSQLKPWKLEGYGGNIYRIPIFIPQNVSAYSQFREEIVESEAIMMQIVDSMNATH